MNELDEILKLNEDFYKKTAASFSSSRKNFWKGWGRVAGIISDKGPATLKVLDLGCGNGRFLGFLQEKFPSTKIEYTGVDSNAAFIVEAKNRSPSGVFLEKDFLEDTPEGKFNLVTAFGVTHHLPTNEVREQFFKTVAERTMIDGLVVLTFWNFDTSKSLNVPEYKRILGKNDYLLGWDNKPDIFRFCHLYDTDELENVNAIFKTNGLTLIDDFFEDGAGSNSNHYFVWNKTDTIRS